MNTSPQTSRPEDQAEVPPRPGVDPRADRIVTVRDHAGIERRWHLLDSAPLLAERGVEPVGTLLCVHGNPTHSFLYRSLIREDIPWRVIAVDQLEMGWSERTGTARRLQDRITDLSLLTDALGVRGPVVTVGHDWGGIIGWFVAGEHPELLTTYTAVSTPHPQAVVRATMADPEQHEKLQYINLLRQEGVAEEKLAADDWAYLRRMIGNLDGARLDEHLRLLGQPGALTAVLNYYRAYRPETGLALGPIPVPTTYVWGNTDVAFGRRAAEGTADFVEAPYTFVELDEGHWISDLQPEPLADAILARVRE